VEERARTVLAVNLQRARELALTIPLSVRVRTDRMVQQRNASSRSRLGVRFLYSALAGVGRSATAAESGP